MIRLVNLLFNKLNDETVNAGCVELSSVWENQEHLSIASSTSPQLTEDSLNGC